MAASRSRGTGGTVGQLELKLPAGGSLHLQTLDEIDLLNEQKKRYEDDYDFDKMNDKVLLGILLTQQLSLFRNQQTISGMEPEIVNSKPTGNYIPRTMKPAEISGAQSNITKASEQIMSLEKALGIDKKTRDASGAETLANYLVVLKRAGVAMGIHVNERLKKYEGFVSELRVKTRLLKNADAEDRAYHGISEKNVMEWIIDQLGELEQADKDFASQKGKLWRGKL